MLFFYPFLSFPKLLLPKFDWDGTHANDIVQSTWTLPTLTNIGLNMANFMNFQMVVALSSLASEL
jgi:hypothetical protein